MYGLPAQCLCKCHEYGSEIKDCKCGCVQCKYCKKHFFVSIINYHIMVCEPYYLKGLDKKEKDERQCGC